MTEIILSCACRATDAYDCWATRYSMSRTDTGAIEEDGGPCQCVCHECRSLEDEYEQF